MIDRCVQTQRLVQQYLEEGRQMRRSFEFTLMLSMVSVARSDRRQARELLTTAQQSHRLREAFERLG